MGNPTNQGTYNILGKAIPGLIRLNWCVAMSEAGRRDKCSAVCRELHKDAEVEKNQVATKGWVEFPKRLYGARGAWVVCMVKVGKSCCCGAQVEGACGIDAV